MAQICTARQRVHGKPRHLDLLAAIGIEVAHFGDGWGLPQQAQEVEAALLKSAARRQEAGRPADLTFDFLDELLDDGGSTLRLFALDGDERLTAFAPGVVHLDGGADDERATNERQEQGGVFAEEPASLLRALRRSGGGATLGWGRGGEGAFGVPDPSPQHVGHL